jgi:hypothetical protein
MAAIESASFWTFLTAFCGMVAAVVAALRSFGNAQKIQEIHLTMNSRLDALLKATEEAAIARGGTIERDRRDASDAALASVHDSKQTRAP